MLILVVALQIAVSNPPTPALTARVGSRERGDRLISQVLRGTQRICIYGRTRTAPTTAVGRGEPCPARYHPPEEETNLVPGMASFVEQSRVAGRLVCTYTLGGRRYRAALTRISRCPLTPNATAEPLIVLPETL